MRTQVRPISRLASALRIKSIFAGGHPAPERRSCIWFSTIAKSWLPPTRNGCLLRQGRSCNRGAPWYHPVWPVTGPLTTGNHPFGWPTSCPANGEPPEQASWGSTTPPVHPSAQERTSAGFLRAGLSVHDPASLAVSPRLLLSVTAFRRQWCSIVWYKL